MKKFLSRLFPAGDVGDVVFVKNRSQRVDDRTKVGVGKADWYVKTNRLDKAAVLVDNIWGIGGLSHLTTVRAITVDADTEEGKPGNGFPKKQVLLDTLTAFGFAPSMVVDSGSGGLHLYYILDKGIDVSSDEDVRSSVVRLFRGFNNWINTLGGGVWKIDERVCSPERLLRLPGTTRADGGKVDLLVGDGPDYSIADFEPMAEPEPESPNFTGQTDGESVISEYLYDIVGLSGVADYLCGKWGWTDLGAGELERPGALSGSASGRVYDSQYTGDEGITIHSSALVADGLLPQKWYSLANLFVTLEFSGDWRAAAKFAYAKGAGQPMVGGDGDVFDRLPFATDMTDYGMAVRMHELLALRYRYAHEWKTWMHFKRGKWQEDVAAKNVKKAVYKELRRIRQVGDPPGDMGADEAWVKWCDKFLTTSRSLDNLMRELQVLRTLQVRAFDRGPIIHMPKVSNMFGWVADSHNVDPLTDLERVTYPGDLNTKLAGCSVSDVADSRWIQFVDEVTQGDRDYAEYLGRIAGYCLLDTIEAQKFFILYGDGANGKSVFMRTIKRVMGDYASMGNPKLLANSGGLSNAEAGYMMAAMEGVRCTIFEESGDRCTLNDASVKALTTPGTIEVRAPYERPRAMQITQTMLLSTNHVPRVTGTDRGIWRRLVLLPFNARFEGDQADPDLDSKFGLGGVLRWMLDGLSRYRAKGLDVDVPVVVSSSHDVVRDDNDLVKQWALSNCQAIPGQYAPFTELLENFNTYQRLMNIPFKMTGQKFAKELTRLGYPSVHVGKDRTRCRELTLNSDGTVMF